MQLSSRRWADQVQVVTAKMEKTVAALLRLAIYQYARTATVLRTVVVNTLVHRSPSAAQLAARARMTNDETARASPPSAVFPPLHKHTTSFCLATRTAIPTTLEPFFIFIYKCYYYYHPLPIHLSIRIYLRYLSESTYLFVTTNEPHAARSYTQLGATGTLRARRHRW